MPVKGAFIIYVTQGQGEIYRRKFIVDWTLNEQFNGEIGMGWRAYRKSISGFHP